MKARINRIIAILRGRTPQGLDKTFDAKVRAFIEKHQDRCMEWKRFNPGKPLPLQIDPRNGELVWASRKTRRK